MLLFDAFNEEILGRWFGTFTSGMKYVYMYKYWIRLFGEANSHCNVVPIKLWMAVLELLPALLV